MSVPAPASNQSLADLLSDGIFVDGDWVETKDQDPSGDVRLVQLADVGDGIFRDRSSRFLAMSKAKELGCTFLQPGDVLVARMPEPLGRACIFPDVGMPAVTAVDVCILRPNPERVNAEWLVKAINSPDFREAMQKFVRGTTRQRISRRNLGALTMTVPPRPGQDRITHLVDRIMSGQRDAAGHVIAGRRAIERFRKAVLAAACSGRLTADWRTTHDTRGCIEELIRRVDSVGKGRETRAAFGSEFDIPESWVLVSLDRLATMVTSGSRGWAKYYSTDGPLFIRSQDIHSDRLDLSEVAHVRPPKGSEGERTRAQRGDLLVTITGANVTRSAFVDCDIDDAYVNQHVALARPAFPELAEYLHLWIVSPQHGRKKLSADAYGAGRPGLNLENIRSLPVGLPPMEEQIEIVSRVHALMEAATRTGERIDAAARVVNLSPQAILAKAFRGELVASANGETGV